MNNLLFKNFKKIHFIYLLITIIIILLLLKVSVEGFIPYLINTIDINDYCTNYPSGQYNAPTLISNYQCGNYSPNTILPISHKINFTNLQLKNNLCPLNTTFIPPNYIGNITSQVCINTNGVVSTGTIASDINLIIWYIFDNTLSIRNVKNITNPIDTPTITPSGSLLLINNPMSILNKINLLDPQLTFKLPYSLTKSNYSTLIYKFPDSGVLTFNLNNKDTQSGTNFVKLYNFGYFNYTDLINANKFTTASMTIFIVYFTVPIPATSLYSSSLYQSSLISGNNLFEITDNKRILNTIIIPTQFDVHTDALLKITLYTASIKQIGSNVVWNEKIYNNTDKFSYSYTFPNVVTWPSCSSINIGGSPNTGFSGNLGEVIIVNNYLDPNSPNLTDPYNIIVINLLNKWNIKPFNVTNAIISPGEYANLSFDNRKGVV